MSEKKVYATKKGTKKGTSRASRNSIRGRKPGNRYLLEGKSESATTSAKKIKMSEDDYNINGTFGYRFINFITVFTAISELVICKDCGSNVKFSETSQRGLGFKIAVMCEKCSPHYINSSPLINNHAYDINRRIIFVMRLLGIGVNGITKFCAFMCLPKPVFHSFYDKIVSNIALATAAVRDRCTRRAAAKERELSIQDNQTEGITVSGDGTWKKRGFSSLLGLSTLIGWRTGKIVDLEVKSKCYKACSLWKNKEKNAEYEEWAEKHKERCESNHTGSSGKMEVDAIVEMFQRSEEKHGLRYSQYIGDGDSRTFKGILDAEPYANFPVTKKECVDHVQKRMGTRLRNLKKHVRGFGGKGKLTGKLIDELSLYYGLAIRRNRHSIVDMKKEIWATLYHQISTDGKPQHDSCPVGADSWCSWQKAKALSQLDDYRHKPPMSQEVFEAVKPVYEELSREDLLSRCLGGYTQNSNESYNAVVWSMAPKTMHSGKKIVNIASDIAACNFNDGLTSVMEIMQVLNLTVGKSCFDFCNEADARRIARAERSMTEEAKKARQTSLSARKVAHEEDIVQEGQLYGAGIAD